MGFLPIYAEENNLVPEVIFEVKNDSYSIEIEYSSNEELLRVNLSKNSLINSDITSGPFSVNNPDEINKSMDEIESVLKSHNISDDDMLAVRERISEFHYISRTGCRALHFSVDSEMNESKNAIESLLNQVTRISTFERESENPIRSQLIDTFKIDEDTKIQLRMNLDSNGKFMSFSFAKDSNENVQGRERNLSNSMDGYSWYSLGNSVYLKNEKGDIVLSVNLDHFKRESSETGESGGLILVRNRRSHFIESEQRSYIRLNSQAYGETTETDKDWTIQRYSMSRFNDNVSREGVALSSSFAEHTPVVQVQGSSVYFPPLAQESDLLSRYPSFQWNDYRPLQETYNECMGERETLLSEQRLNGQDVLNVNEKENVRFCERMSLLNSLNLNEDLAFRSCLLEKKILLTVEGFESLNYNAVKEYNDTQFSEDVSSCVKVNSAQSLESALFLRVENNKISLTLQQREALASFLDTCVQSREANECEEQARGYLDFQETFEFLEGVSKTEFSCNSLDIENNHSFEACLENAKNSALDSYEDYFFKEAFHSIKLNQTESVDYEKIRNEFKMCMNGELDKQNQTLAIKEKWYQIEQYCLLENLKQEAKTSFNHLALSKLDELMGWVEPMLQEDLGHELREVISQEIEKWTNFSDYEEIKEKIAISTYSILLSHYLEHKIQDVDDREFQAKMRSFLLTENGDISPAQGASSNMGMPLRLSSRSIGRRLESRISSIPARARLSFVKNFINTVELTAFGYTEAKLRESEEDQLDDEVYTRTENERRACIENIDTSMNTLFSDEMKLCQMESFSKIQLEQARVEFEGLVGTQIQLNSIEANEQLKIIPQLKECLNRYEAITYYSDKRFEHLMKGCFIAAKISLETSLLKLKLNSYGELGSASLQDLSLCKGSLFNDTEIEEDDSLFNQWTFEDLSKEENLSDATRFLEKLSLHSGAIQSNFGSCLSRVEKTLTDSVKAFFVDQIPALQDTMDGHLDNEKNREVLNTFFDEELISLLIDFTNLSDQERTQDQYDLGGVVAEERVLTTGLGTSSLRHFLSSLGHYFDKGFIFDESAMRTELVVFKSELKDFLRWYKSNPDDVTIREAKSFFSESELGEHLAMAAVSERVYTRFTSGINTMREEELKDFFSQSNCKSYYNCFERRRRNSNILLKEKYDAIIEKYDNLLELTKTMTASYDFRRIIRPETREGQEIISLAHDVVIAPEIFGVSGHIQGEENLMRSVGKTILADNTDGGFSERFVEEIVQHSLDQEEASRSALGKWLFYDHGDFDWDTLRKTESGQVALNYYARFIMLPRMLDQRQSSYIENLRQTQFEKLMRQAQDENEH